MENFAVEQFRRENQSQTCHKEKEKRESSKPCKDVLIVQGMS